MRTGVPELLFSRPLTFGLSNISGNLEGAVIAGYFSLAVFAEEFNRGHPMLISDSSGLLEESVDLSRVDREIGVEVLAGEVQAAFSEEADDLREGRGIHSDSTRFAGCPSADGATPNFRMNSR